MCDFDKQACSHGNVRMEKKRKEKKTQVYQTKQKKRSQITPIHLDISDIHACTLINVKFILHREKK